jgi:FAD/FMN-containing dehydrogenase
MNRRQFCRSAAAAGVAATYPWSILAAEANTNISAISLDGDDIDLERAAIRELADQLEGPLLLAKDPQYDAARRVWNGMHDRHPALIAQCLGSGDVRHTIDFAREHRLLTAVRGGGHSWPGKSVCEGGLMIDLSRMNDVKVEADIGRARVSGGALLNGLDTAALTHGLATTAGVVSHTGVGGFTLGGGFGRLNRKYGLAIDNLLAAEIVTADGRLRRISDDEEADLFWAIRGGGGNFGVVTGFDFRLHPFNRSVLSGNILTAGLAPSLKC